MIYILHNYHTELIYLIRVIIGCACAVAIGLERKYRNKDAGPKTHFVVALSATLMTCVSISFIGDEARIAAQIVSGIGFLGAGMIFFRRENLRGLTTAAGVWGTAGIGMAAGAGLYILAIGTTVIFVLGQTIMHSDFANKKAYRQMLLIKMIYNYDLAQKLKTTFEIEKFHRFKVVREKNDVRAEAVIRTKKRFSAEELATFMVDNPHVLSLKRLEDL